MRVVIVLATVPFLCLPINATETPEILDITNAQKILDELPPALDDGLNVESLQESGGVLRSFLQLIQNIVTESKDFMRAPFNLFVRTMGVALFSLLLGFANDGTSGARSMRFAVNAAVCLSVGGIVSSTIITMINGADETVSIMSRAIESMLPVLSGILVASGGFTSAALYGFATSVAASAVASIMKNVVHPLTGILLGLGLVSALCENDLHTLAEGIRRGVIRVLGIVSTGFVSLLSLQTLISGNTDNLALKAARLILGNSVPIIGHAVSDAAATLAGSLRIVKGTVGVAGILLIAALLLPRILMCMLCSVSLSLSAVCCDALMLPEMTRCLRTIRTSIDIVTATLSFYAVVLISCTAIMIRVGSGG